MKFRLAFTFGRFNLLHRGHVDLFNQMGQTAEEILIGVSSGPKNLSYATRRKVIKTALKEDWQFDSPFLVETKRSPFGLLELINHKPEDTVVYLGQDQFELGQTLTREFGCSTICIPRLTSSTTIRHLIDSEQWSMLAREVPQSIINDVIFLREQELCHASH